MKGSIPLTVPRRTGRPLSFDREDVLRKAMLLFWKNGYEGTTLNELTVAMGVTPPSIYTAFGSKKALFLEAVSRYLSDPSPEEIIERASSARDAAHDLMRAAAVTFTSPANPRGCLLASSAVACSEEAHDVRDSLAKVRLGIEASLRKRISRGIRDGELAPDKDAGVLAALAIAVIQGMSTLARDGASKAKLLNVVETAMAAWE